MKRKSLFALFTALCLAASPAWADVVQGKIAGLNASGVNLAVYDEQGRAYPNLLPLRLDPKQLTGLRTYDWVRAEILQTKTGAWQAKSIKRIPTPQATPAGAPYGALPQQPNAFTNVSSNLKNALSTPQAQSAVRGGLMGAVTGAISSGVSGGKAGKGALIGAGVGAAAGLLQTLFSAPAPQPQPAGQPYVIQERPQHVSGSRIVRHFDKDGHLVSEEEIR